MNISSTDAVVDVVSGLQREIGKTYPCTIRRNAKISTVGRFDYVLEKQPETFRERISRHGALLAAFWVSGLCPGPAETWFRIKVPDPKVEEQISGFISESVRNGYGLRRPTMVIDINGINVHNPNVWSSNVALQA
jgi:hypothetical protein